MVAAVVSRVTYLGTYHIYVRICVHAFRNGQVHVGIYARGCTYRDASINEERCAYQSMSVTIRGLVIAKVVDGRRGKEGLGECEAAKTQSWDNRC